jgi:phosphonate transport system substrate-binding protein
MSGGRRTFGAVRADDQGWTRRGVLTGLGGALAAPAASRAVPPLFQFGLTPVFLTSDLALLEGLQRHLARLMGGAVRLVLKRTYQEITSQLVAGQIDAAWICGFPLVAYRPQLAPVAVPVWRGAKLYQAYLIEAADRSSRDLDDLRGDSHAFSDPDSNSGFLVTQALLAARGVGRDGFFARSFFTYGHRNVVRAVASGLAQSGSVDGYIWEVLTEVEPELTRRTRVVWRSDWMGFPPIATAQANLAQPSILRFREALLGMAADPEGRAVLRLLRLDGFADAEVGLYDGIATLVRQVRGA